MRLAARLPPRSLSLPRPPPGGLLPPSLRSCPPRGAYNFLPKIVLRQKRKSERQAACAAPPSAACENENVPTIKLLPGIALKELKRIFVSVICAVTIVVQWMRQPFFQWRKVCIRWRVPCLMFPIPSCAIPPLCFFPFCFWKFWYI